MYVRLQRSLQVGVECTAAIAKFFFDRVTHPFDVAHSYRPRPDAGFRAVSLSKMS